MSRAPESHPEIVYIKGVAKLYTPQDLEDAAYMLIHDKTSEEYLAVYALYPIRETSPQWFTHTMRFAWYLALRSGHLTLNENNQISPEDVAPPRKRF